MNLLILKDNKGCKYVVDDPNRFKQHLFDYHSYNGKADLSIHEENGHYFTVTTKLLDEVNEYIRKNKK